MAQKPMLRAEVYARALRASQNVKRAEVWVGARCALWVGGAWASAGVEGTRLGWRDPSKSWRLCNSFAAKTVQSRVVAAVAPPAPAAQASAWPPASSLRYQRAHCDTYSSTWPWLLVKVIPRSLCFARACLP